MEFLSFFADLEYMFICLSPADPARCRPSPALGSLSVVWTTKQKTTGCSSTRQCIHRPLKNALHAPTAFGFRHNLQETNFIVDEPQDDCVQSFSLILLERTHWKKVWTVRKSICSRSLCSTPLLKCNGPPA